MFNLINSRLSIAARLSLIAAIFLAPVGLLVYLFIQQSSGDISFATKEIAGTQYLTSVWPAFAKTGETTNASAGPFTGNAGYDKLFDTADSAAAFAGANDVKAKLATGSTLIGAIADGSNLTLDPDLDSFYAMDAATVRLPGILMAAVTLGQAAAETPGTSARTIHIAYAVNQLEMSTQQAGASLDAAMKNNAAGDTARALAKDTAALKAASVAVIAQGQALLDGRNAVDLAALRQALLQQVDTAWVTANTELARLLQARVDRLFHKMLVNLIIAAGFLIAAMALSAVIARGLSKRLGTLLKVMDQLVANDPSAEVPYRTDRNETGRIAQTLMAFRQSVVERGKLQSEKALVEELAEERRRSAEERESAARKQTHIVETIADGLEHLAGGDLTVCLTETFPPEFERLRLDLNKAVEQLKQTMVTVSTSALTIQSNSQEVATSARDLSGRTENQAASLEETAAALDQITATVKKTAEGANHAHDVVMSAKSDAEQSDIIVRQATKAMMSIEGSAKKISEIIGVMDEIAFQTNLLALNAGVEAARAGDSGRGFAVVAQEVRALAQRSAEAAKEIKGLILDSSKHVGEGVALVEKTGTALGRIVTRVADIDNAVKGIAASAAEQAAGLSQVNTAINQMDQLTQQNAAMVEQSTAASYSLSQETEMLSSLIGRFKIGQQTIQKQAPVYKPPAIRRPASGHSPASIRHDRRKEPRPPVLKTVLGGSSSGNSQRDDDWKEF